MDNDFLSKYQFGLSDKALQRVGLLIKLNYDLKECFFIIAKKHVRAMKRKKNYREIEIKHKELHDIHAKLITIIYQLDRLFADIMDELREAADCLDPENSDTPDYGTAFIEKVDVEYYLSLASNLPTNNN